MQFRGNTTGFRHITTGRVTFLFGRRGDIYPDVTQRGSKPVGNESDEFRPDSGDRAADLSHDGIPHTGDGLFETVPEAGNESDHRLHAGLNACYYARHRRGY